MKDEEKREPVVIRRGDGLVTIDTGDAATTMSEATWRRYQELAQREKPHA